MKDISLPSLGKGSFEKRLLLVVGNGAASIDNTGGAFINGHTLDLLQRLNRIGLFVTYCELRVPTSQTHGLVDSDLATSGIGHWLISNNRMAFCLALPNLVRRIALMVKTAYLFYPGTLPKVLSLIMMSLKVPFGLYVRGALGDLSCLDKYIIRRARFVVAVSPHFAATLADLNQNIIIPQPLMGDRLLQLEVLPKPQYAKVASKLLYVGRLEFGKGIEELINGFSYIHQKRPDIALLLVGTGPLLKWLTEHPLTKAGGVQLHPPEYNWERLSQLYLDADMFVFMSHAEGFPRVIYEAMYFGLPIITTIVGGMVGQLLPHVNCIGVDVKCPESLATAIDCLVDNKELRERIGMSGQSYIKKVFGERPLHSDALFDQIQRL